MTYDYEDAFIKVLPTIKDVIVYPDIEKASYYNPYLSLFYANFTKRVQSATPLSTSPFKYQPKTELIHFHWLEATSIMSLFTIFLKLFPILLFLKRGGIVFWTLHNLSPHRKKWQKFNFKLQKWFGSKVTRIIVHTNDAKEKVISKFNFTSSHVLVMPHPLYPVKHPPVHEVIRFLEAEKIFHPYVLMYGMVAPYKGILEVINFFSSRSLPYDLVIAGKTKKGDEQYGREVEAAIKDNPQIHFLHRRISDEDEALLFKGTYAALFNFTTILTSGTVMLAYSYGAKIISAAAPTALPEEATYSVYNNFTELAELLQSESNS